MNFVGFCLDGFPSLSEEWQPVDKQVDMLRHLAMSVDVIINLKVGVV